jgi:acetylornithine deacetylase/succinyl-diaminopimelate desuccinylase-like protein
MSVLDLQDARPDTGLSRLIDDATKAIDGDFLRSLTRGMVDIPSPTGEEAELAAWLVSTMSARGMPARLQPIDDRQANALGRVAGTGGGADLLLYAPIDTLTAGTDDEDLPWIGPALRPDMRTEATEAGDFVLGLGASNPKGHAASIITAVDAVLRAGSPLRGDVLVGLGAGGMPTNRRPASHLTRFNTGQGAGCSFMLEQGFWADYAVIAKPGWAAAWEEVGLCWFEVTVRGTFGYVGSRHRMAYRNAIADAGIVIQELERWLPGYTARHTRGLVAPQGHVGSIEGGWRRMAAVSPAACRFLMDLRIGPDTTPLQARAEFGEAMRAILVQHPELDAEWDMVLAIPGTRTDQSSFVVAAAVEAWEAIAGDPHKPIVANSGATDANILRNRGVPTVRIGMDRIGPDAPVPLDFPSGMNIVDLREAHRLTRHLVRMIINVCGRAVTADAGSR